MIYKINIDLNNPILRTSFPALVKGDSFKIDITLSLESGEDISNWKIRCEICDTSNSIQLATANSGGSVNEIAVTNGLQGKFEVNIEKDLTANFLGRGQIEIEVETDDNPTRRYTVLQTELIFIDERINWNEPS